MIRNALNNCIFVLAATNKSSYIYVSCVTKTSVFMHSIHCLVGKTCLQFVSLYKNTHMILSTGSTMYVAHIYNSVLVHTFRIPCSRGLQLVKDYALSITLSTQACATNHQLIEITKNKIYSLCYYSAINHFLWSMKNVNSRSKA